MKTFSARFRIFLVLLEREMKSYFYSPIAYFVLCFFLALAGFNTYAVVSLLAHGAKDHTVLEGFFGTLIFWFIFVPMIPLITMRLYAEEFKSGTIETLLTAPVNDWQVVLSKFAGAVLFYLVLWLPTALHFAVFQYVTGTPVVPTAAPVIGAYLLLLLVGMFYLSLGCLASVLTRDQIVAAIVSLVFVILVFFFGVLGTILSNTSQIFRDFVSYFATAEHMGNFSRGIFDTRPIIFYLSMTVLLQVITYHIFQFRKWKA